MISMLKQLRSVAFGLLALFFSAGMILSSCTGQTGNADGAETEAVDEAAGEEHPSEESTDEHPSEESSEHPSDTTAAEGEHPSDGE
jgi:hypothetical protein